MTSFALRTARARRSAAVGLVAGGAAFAAAGCDGASPNPAPDEVLQIASGQFVPGALPGTLVSSALDAGAGDGAPSSAPEAGAILPLSITQLALPVLPLPVGAAGESISGYASDDAASVGVRFADLGTGYWIVPVGVTDAQYPGQITFGMKALVRPRHPGGYARSSRRRHRRVRASRRASPGHRMFPERRARQRARVQSRDPRSRRGDLADVGHELRPRPARRSRRTAKTSIPRRPSASFRTAGARPPATLPSIDRDSLARLRPGRHSPGRSRSSRARPPRATTRSTSTPLPPCGQAAVRFTVTVYTSVGTCPACSLQSGVRCASSRAGSSSPVRRRAARRRASSSARKVSEVQESIRDRQIPPQSRDARERVGHVPAAPSQRGVRSPPWSSAGGSSGSTGAAAKRSATRSSTFSSTASARRPKGCSAATRRSKPTSCALAPLVGRGGPTRSPLASTAR